MSDRGRIIIISSDKGSAAGKLFNFDIARSELKPEHEDWLRRNVVDILKRRGSLAVIGLASRTDTDDFNMILSRKRADAVIGFLRKEAGANFKIKLDIALGERAAQYAGDRDDVENENWRAVVVHAWPRPDPPPPPMPRRTVIERRMYVKIPMEASIKDSEDDAEFAGPARDAAQRAFGGHPTEEKKKFVSSDYKILKVFTSLDTTGSSNSGITVVTIKNLLVSYLWGVRKVPCLLVDRYYLQGAFKNNGPRVARLSDAQADLWVQDPFKAQNSVSDWNLHYLSLADYENGKQF